MSDQLTQELLSFEADHTWIHDHQKVLVKQYTDQWIAVKNEQVMASDPDLDGLLAKLADPSHTCVEFITLKPMEMVL